MVYCKGKSLKVMNIRLLPIHNGNPNKCIMLALVDISKCGAQFLQNSLIEKVTLQWNTLIGHSLTNVQRLLEKNVVNLDATIIEMLKEHN